MITKYQSEFEGTEIDEGVEYALLLKHDKATDKEKAALQLLAANAYVIDDTNGKTYKIGSSDGKFYFTESDVSVKEIVDSILEAAEVLNKSETE